MAYNASPGLGGDSVASRRLKNILHLYDSRNPSVSRFFNPPNTGQHPQISSDSSTGAGRNINSIDSAQSNYMDNTFNHNQGGNARHQHVLTHLPYTSPLPPTSLPRLPHLPTCASGTILSPLNMWPRFGEPNYSTSCQTPVEDAMSEQMTALITGVSENYLGDPHLTANQSANIPDELNTSVWITNLPPNLNHKMLLDSVRNCGKVYAAVINAPERNHITAASKLVFFDVAGCENLLIQAREGRFIVGGYIPRVRRNRIKTAPKAPSPNSRVLHIEGPSCIINQRYLASLYRADDITWQDEEVIVLSSNAMTTRLEWRFGSFRCQAESARHVIERLKRQVDLISSGQRELGQRVTVHFGVDPCAPQPGK
ncbi:hypothetical protein E0Z10_g4375 [Xylaria hypoxylon]|uniref:RRM domain-containing protein n=1 Tax=Xylaria hypoxylon TaxID=37992 RepID=A0A4Z0YWU5_9PEZI|nr:hypothetical protein E0Z10_g4375 [Xylaria hypoxylon]